MAGERFEEIVNDRGRKVRRKVVTCQCGRDVWCTGFTNPCDCGRDYNMSGHLLASRAQWGEETGEDIRDILMADIDPFGGEG